MLTATKVASTLSLVRPVNTSLVSLVIHRVSAQVAQATRTVRLVFIALVKWLLRAIPVERVTTKVGQHAKIARQVTRRQMVIPHVLIVHRVILVPFQVRAGA